MKVLFACHRLPYPPKRGGKIRPFNIIRHLTESGHRVSVASLARSVEEVEEGKGLSGYCEKVLVGRIGQAGAVMQMIARLPTRRPSSMGFFFSRDLHRSARAELEEHDYDLVFAHCSSAAQYLSRANGIPSIIDFGDMDSQKWLDYSTFKARPLAWGYRLEGAKLHKEEIRLARRFDLSTCTTRAELDTLKEYSAARRHDWFPNGVDSEYFKPTDEPYDPNLVSFVGRMDYYPNQQAMLWFCHDVLPIIQARRPGARLTIIGADPSRSIRALGRLPGVSVTGTVTDVRDHVRRSAVSVAPLIIARGTQNKILEAMAMGVPVVCSPAAAKGVDAIAERHLLVANTPEEYACAIVSVMEDAKGRERLAQAGRNRVLSNHSWASSMQKLDGIIESLLERPVDRE